MAADRTSVWAQYTVVVEHGSRDALVAALAAEGILSAIYYPTPLHRQTAYRRYSCAAGGLPVAGWLSHGS